MTSLVVVSAGLSNPSSTRLLADRLTTATIDALGQTAGPERSAGPGQGEVSEPAVFPRQVVVPEPADLHGQVEVTHVELRHLAHQLTDQLLTGFAAPELATAQAAVQAADGLIVVTPVFAASYSGLFKTFFDVLTPGALDATPVLIAATAGTPRHSLVLEHALRPLFAYLHAVVVPTGVFAATDDFAGHDLAPRITRAARELAAQISGPGPLTQPSPRRRTVADQFAAPTPFEDLLRRATAG